MQINSSFSILFQVRKNASKMWRKCVSVFYDPLSIISSQNFRGKKRRKKLTFSSNTHQTFLRAKTNFWLKCALISREPWWFFGQTNFVCAAACRQKMLNASLERRKISMIIVCTGFAPKSFYPKEVSTVLSHVTVR